MDSYLWPIPEGEAEAVIRLLKEIKHTFTPYLNDEQKVMLFEMGEFYEKQRLGERCTVYSRRFFESDVKDKLNKYRVFDDDKNPMLIQVRLKVYETFLRMNEDEKFNFLRTLDPIVEAYAFMGKPLQYNNRKRDYFSKIYPLISTSVAHAA